MQSWEIPVMRWAGRAGGVNGRGCNQHLQLASAPAGLKGSTTKCSIPHPVPPSHPSVALQLEPFQP